MDFGSTTKHPNTVPKKKRHDVWGIESLEGEEFRELREIKEFRKVPFLPFLPYKK
jgi:hypothetical protein